MRLSRGSYYISVLTCLFVGPAPHFIRPAYAIEVRNDYDPIFNQNPVSIAGGSVFNTSPSSSQISNFQRYQILANQPRFDTVGGLTFGGAAPGCTGTLISSNVVLTAAHCLYKEVPGPHDTTLGYSPLFTSLGNGLDKINNTANIGFASGSVIRLPPQIPFQSFYAQLGLTTKSINYYGTADEVWVDPSFLPSNVRNFTINNHSVSLVVNAQGSPVTSNLLSNDADLALIRIASRTWNGAPPSNYLSL